MDRIRAAGSYNHGSRFCGMLESPENFKRDACQSSTLRNSDFIGIGCNTGIEIFQIFPGDCRVHSGVGTTASSDSVNIAKPSVYFICADLISLP